MGASIESVFREVLDANTVSVEAAQAVRHDIHPAMPRLFAYSFDMWTKKAGRGAYVAGQRGVVERLDLGPSVSLQGTAQQGERRPVVHEAVEQQHGRVRAALGGQGERSGRRLAVRCGPTGGRW